jgi:hypothetical protein
LVVIALVASLSIIGIDLLDPSLQIAVKVTGVLRQGNRVNFRVT